MNASTRAVAANFFQCAEHEVEEKLRILSQILEAFRSGTPTAGPSQQDFDALKADYDELKSRVDHLEATLNDLTTPEIADGDAPKP